MRTLFFMYHLPHFPLIVQTIFHNWRKSFFFLVKKHRLHSPNETILYFIIDFSSITINFSALNIHFSSVTMDFGSHKIKNSQQGYGFNSFHRPVYPH